MSRSPCAPAPSLAALALAILAAACSAPSMVAPDAAAQPIPPVQPRERSVDIEHYAISVDLDHLAGHVDGSVTVAFRALPDRPADTLLLDAVELDVSAVWDDDGDKLAHTLVDDLLTIDLGRSIPPGERGEVTVEYDGFPRRGLYFVGPTAQDGDRPWHIWSQGQAEDTRHWIPVWDIPNELATHELEVTVDAEFVTMAAGERTSSVETRDGRRTDRWRMQTPHVSYLITLVAGGYAVGMSENDALDGRIELPVLAEPEHLELALQNFAEQDDQLAYMGDLLGIPYPYSKYANSCVREFTAGGMENISATTLYYRTIHQPDDEPQTDSVGLLAHEAGHQWFGDLLTCASWTDLWLNEGFADWIEGRYLGATRGPDRAAWQRLQSIRGYLFSELSRSKPIVWDGWDHPDDTFSGHAYAGGASRVNLLEAVLGEETLVRGVTRYVQQHRGTAVDTEDLRAALHAESGRDLELFFEQWLYGPGVPRFRVSAQGPTDTAQVTWTIEQTQVDEGWAAAYHAPVDVVWSRNGVEQRRRVAIVERIETLTLPGPVDWLRFDADTRVPMLLAMHQDEAAWRAQLRDATDGVTRMLAAEWFSGGRFTRPDRPDAWAADDESVAALIAAVDHDPFVPVRLAALAALDGLSDALLVPVLERSILDGDARVRAAAATALGEHGGDAVLPLLFDASEDGNATVAAAAFGALVKRELPGAFRLLSRRLAETPDVEWRLKRSLLDQLVDTEDERLLPLFVGVARSDPESRVRARALQHLAHYDGAHSEVIYRMLCESLHDASRHVRSAAVRGLLTRGDTRALPHLRARQQIEIDLGVLGALRGAVTRLQRQGAGDA